MLVKLISKCNNNSYEFEKKYKLQYGGLFRDNLFV